MHTHTLNNVYIVCYLENSRQTNNVKTLKPSGSVLCNWSEYMILTRYANVYM